MWELAAKVRTKLCFNVRSTMHSALISNCRIILSNAFFCFFRGVLLCKEQRFYTTLGARGFSCAVSGVGHVSIVTRAKNLWSRINLVQNLDLKADWLLMTSQGSSNLKDAVIGF